MDPAATFAPESSPATSTVDRPILDAVEAAPQESVPVSRIQRLNRATASVDRWIEAWAADDPQAVADAFHEDGLYIDMSVGFVRGRDAIVADASKRVWPAINERRTSPLRHSLTAEEYAFSAAHETYETSWIVDIEVKVIDDLLERVTVTRRVRRVVSGGLRP